jgi:hypothetical protein
LYNKKEARDYSRKIIIREVDIWQPGTHTLLELTLSPAHPVERDYDQLLFVLNKPEVRDWKNYWVEPFLKRLGIEFNGSLSKENLMYHIDLIPDYVWECCMGSYRSAESIPGKSIRDIGFEYLIFTEVLKNAKNIRSIMRNVTQNMIRNVQKH